MARPDDIDALTDREIMNLPAGTLEPGQLTRYWSRIAMAAEREKVDELDRERAGNFITGKKLIQDPKEKAREDRRRETNRQLQDIRDRESRLLKRIEEEQRRIEERQREIEERAIRLRDGRRVYVDGDEYRDGEGRALTGDNAIEAAAQHRQHPEASTWQQKTKTDMRWNELERLKNKVQERRVESEGRELSDEEIQQKEDAINQDEKELQQIKETRRSGA